MSPPHPGTAVLDPVPIKISCDDGVAGRLRTCPAPPPLPFDSGMSDAAADRAVAGAEKAVCP